MDEVDEIFGPGLFCSKSRFRPVQFRKEDYFQDSSRPLADSLLARFPFVTLKVVEAIYWQALRLSLKQCGNLLKPGGRMVMQAIVMPEQRCEAYRRGIDFIQKYIFPGGFLRSIAALQHSVGRTTDFRLESIEDLTSHYARALWSWRKRFEERLDSVRSLGFDDRFIRMWRYYLCYCEAAFREQAVRVVQIVWDRPPR